MDFSVYMPARVVAGRGVVRKNAGLFSALGGACLIVTSATAAEKSGALADCMAALSEAGVRCTVFSGMEPNPKTETCRLAGQTARENGAAFIVGIGGGSAMDGAKAAAIYAANPGFSHADIYTRKVPSAALPVVLIGTTAGTGSEVTGVSVLTNAETGLKKSISGADCYARISFCDYGYTLGVPAAVTRSTALDALAHAVESRFSATANDLSAVYADRAVSLLRTFFEKEASGKAPTGADREAWYAASIYAGLAINITGTVFPHTLGYHLTERYGVPHGIACAAFMPVLLGRAEKNCPDALGAIETALGASVRDLEAYLRKTIRFDFTVSEQEARDVALRWKNGIKNFDRSPGGFTCEDAVQAYLSL